MLLRNSHKAFLCVCTLSGVVGSPAYARIQVEAARITGGELWILGSTDEPEAEITLDRRFPTKADKRGNFEMRVVYHPPTCIATLRTAHEERSVVVGECGQQGQPGVAGPVGPRGEAGPAGPPGEMGPAGAQGLPGLTGRDGIAGPAGPAGETGPRGLRGPPVRKGRPACRARPDRQDPRGSRGPWPRPRPRRRPSPFPSPAPRRPGRNRRLTPRAGPSSRRIRRSIRRPAVARTPRTGTEVRRTPGFPNAPCGRYCGTTSDA